MPGVFYASIEQADGRALVQTGSGARLTSDVSLDAESHDRPSLASQLQSRTVQVSAPIRSGGRVVGHLVLVSRTEGRAGKARLQP